MYKRQALAKDLKKRGWSFVGPTTVYAFMQAMGLVNDHLDCLLYTSDAADERSSVDLGGRRIIKKKKQLL